MMDMLVRLYDLPDIEEDLRRLEREGFLIRRPGAYERHLVADWVGRNFSPKWVSEAKVAFGRQPISCYIATREKKILGFACYDVTARGFLGPMGVAEEVRRSGLGTVLLVSALKGLRELGYAYGVIGGVGPADFYARAVGAMPIGRELSRHLHGYFAGTIIPPVVEFISISDGFFSGLSGECSRK